MGRPGKVLEYRTLTERPSRTLEYGTKADGRYVVLQTAALAEKWPEVEETFSRILKSVELFDPKPEAAEPPPKRKEPPELSGDSEVLRHIMQFGRQTLKIRNAFTSGEAKSSMVVVDHRSLSFQQLCSTIGIVEQGYAGVRFITFSVSCCAAWVDWTRRLDPRHQNGDVNGK